MTERSPQPDAAPTSAVPTGSVPMSAGVTGALPAGAGPDLAVPGTGRVLGVDLGSRRIGVAASDDAQRLAVGIATVERTRDVLAHRRAVGELVAEYEVVGVVVGLPRSMDGREGPAAIAAREEAAALAEVAGVPVVLADERLTTVSASAALRAGGRRATRQRPVIDRTAAAIILQAWLDRRRATLMVVATGG